ncbi:MAG: glycogen synthase [Chitinophagaceae bacterium]|jgi:starch synthase|nr:glycogen synthase [Chitinophagaceae bacterium]
MEIIHVSAECYPMAKAGGLADVVGALPKYQNQLGHIAKVVMPMHRTKFLYDNDWEVVHKSSFVMGPNSFEYTIIKEQTNKLGFDLYCVDINGLLDREKIYSYSDDTERFCAFQIAVVDWLSKWQHRPDIVHVHDHHSALIPFMMQHCIAYNHLAAIPTVLTIHNAQYQGWMGWDKQNYIPAWDIRSWGNLDWNDTINPLACGIKCAARVTTVSPSYMEELVYDANGLEKLFQYEKSKCVGILNGIDNETWSPVNDTYITDNFSIKNFEEGKLINKKTLCKEFGLDIKKPLVVFIGRLVGEKSADLLPRAITDALRDLDGAINFLILGSGDANVEQQLLALNNSFVGYYNSQIGYNEKLSHIMYAGADFLLMPSRIEPCGLNQMYAMRYGTVPIVRRTGGLKDTVIDYEDPGGFGICFDRATVWDISYSLHRAVKLYGDKNKLSKIIKKLMNIDNSWEKSAGNYISIYQQLST